MEMSYYEHSEKVLLSPHLKREIHDTFSKLEATVKEASELLSRLKELAEASAPELLKCKKGEHDMKTIDVQYDFSTEQCTVCGTTKTGR